MERVAALFDTPFIFVYSSKMASGLLTEEAERAGKVTIGGEFGHSEGVSLRGIRHAYEGARNVLKHYRVLPGEVTRIDPSITPRVVKAIGLSEYIPAPFSGIYEPATALGSSVEEGQILGRLYDFERVEAPPTEVRAPHAGWLMAQTFNAPVVKGDTMIVVANEV
jgi:predicted deacylase